MTENTTPSRKRRRPNGSTSAQPDWAKGLKSLYDSVVDEPLPDDMLRLLASLDAASDGEPGGHG